MPEECPLAVQLLYDRCTAPDPEARPSARQVYDELVAAIKGTPANEAEMVHPARSAPPLVTIRDEELSACEQETPFSTALSHPVSREPGSTGSRDRQPSVDEDLAASLVPSLLGVQVAVRPRTSSTPLPTSSRDSLGPRMSQGPVEPPQPLKAMSLRLGAGDPRLAVGDRQEPDWLKLARRVSQSSRRVVVVVDEGSGANGVQEGVEGPKDTPSMTPPSPFMMTSL